MKIVTLSVFDFDGTMAPGDSIVAYLFYARRQKVLSVGRLLLIFLSAIAWKMRLVSGEKQKAYALRFLQKLTIDERNAFDRNFVEQEVLPHVYADAKKALHQERQSGKTTVLLSASTDHYMRYVAEKLGFDVLLCTELLPDGTIAKNCKGPEKLRRLKSWLAEQDMFADWENSSAYGDSGSDQYVMNACGQRCLVNAKKSLRRAFPDGTVVTWH